MHKLSGNVVTGRCGPHAVDMPRADGIPSCFGICFKVTSAAFASPAAKAAEAASAPCMAMSEQEQEDYDTR